jgi:hypothetical protein
MSHASKRPKLIDLDTDLAAFFRDVVCEAVRGRGHRTSGVVESYLAALLADYGRPGALQREVLDSPVSFLLREALESHGTDRFERLRRLGDDVLYMSGFFGDHLARRGVEVSFVTGVGARAYDAAGAILRAASTESTGPDVFAELSDTFGSLVGVLGDVAETLTARAVRSPQEAIELYGKWLETGSTRLADELSRWGLVVPREAGVLN